MDRNKVIEVLEEFNEWRRGSGPYAWSEDPSKSRQFPYSPHEIGVAIDRAVEMLRRLSEIHGVMSEDVKVGEVVRAIDGNTTLVWSDHGAVQALGRIAKVLEACEQGDE